MNIFNISIHIKIKISFISLPTDKLYKKQEKTFFFPAGYVGRFYRNLADVDDFLGSDFYGKIANDTNNPTEDVQKYTLATSDFPKGCKRTLIIT